MLLFAIITAIGLWSVQGSPFKQHFWNDPPKDIYRFCNTTPSYVVIQSLTISPDPPQKNAVLTISFAITTSMELTGGAVSVKAYLGTIPVYSGSLNLCSLAKHANMTCPIQPGGYSSTIKTFIPKAAPSGHYSGSAVAVDQNRQMIGCIDLSFSL